MNNLIKRAVAMLLVCVMLCSSGCSSSDGSGYVFKYDITGNPETLDPQLANEINSELIITNVFMGLLTLNADGSLSEGVAEDYIMSEDALTYTFRLRQDVYWTDANGFEAQCTAHDFVYAFQRLFDPETNAPRAQEYYCIKNSQAVNNGAVSDLSVIGVKANGDFELEITLDYPDIRFLTLLTEPPAMPCCEQYFLGAQGKYGLSAECTPSNGAFYVKSWDYDPYTITDNNSLVLRRNEMCGETVYPSGLNFFIEEDGDFVADFLAGTTSCIAVSDEQAAEIPDDYPYEAFANITVGLVFNTDYELFLNESFRMALALLVDREAIGNALPHYSAASAIVPAEVTLLDKSYREYVGEELAAEYNEAAAQALYSSVKDSLDKTLFTGARIIAPDDSAATAVSYVMQEWQREFGFYCVVEVLDENEYRSRLESGDFEIAITELTGSENTPAAYLESFTKGNSGNVGGFVNARFEKLLSEAQSADDLAEGAKIYAEAEQLIIDKAAFVPLYYKNEFFFTAKDSFDIAYNSFTETVDFSQAKK